MAASGPYATSPRRCKSAVPRASLDLRGPRSGGDGPGGTLTRHPTRPGTSSSFNSSRGEFTEQCGDAHPRRPSEGSATTTIMTGPSPAFELLSSAALLAATRDLVRKSRGVEAELLSHLGEIDERKLYLDCASSSMFAFCVQDR